MGQRPVWGARAGGARGRGKGAAGLGRNRVCDARKEGSGSTRSRKPAGPPLVSVSSTRTRPGLE